jgi:hypothetical protein
VLNTRSHRLGLGIAAVCTAAAAVAVPASLGRATPVNPSLRLMTAVRHVQAERFGSSPYLYIPSAVYVAATNGGFEIDASHKNGKVILEQVRRNGSTVTKIRRISTPAPVRFERGLPQFFSAALTDSTGKVVMRLHPDFCPAAQYDSQRVSPSGPDNPTYPQFCGDHLTRSMPWGIDAGWADPEYLNLKASTTVVPDGTYTLTMAIAPSYARQLRVAPADRKATLTVDVVTESDGCTDICAEARRSSTSAAVHRPHRNRVMAAATKAHPTGLPDLIALPAHNLGIIHDTKNGRDYLGFGATIWNAGPGTFDVEGFRHGTWPTMVARQYLFSGNHSVRSMKIGRFEFDTRTGHEHWHLEDVARYDLLDAKQNRVVLSTKQSFCLAPTDPINLMRPGALWNPDTVGLASSCPTDQSLWLRETLPVGWGDTYLQQRGGQSFNITDLPNGRYLIRIATNPFGNIHETTRSNDTALLGIELGGTPGSRTVTKLGPVH